jgi:hypothetical protein
MSDPDDIARDLAAIDAVIRRRAREVLARIDAVQERRRKRFPLTAEKALQRACWRALVRAHREGKLPQHLTDKFPGLTEALRAETE